MNWGSIAHMPHEKSIIAYNQVALLFKTDGLTDPHLHDEREKLTDGITRQPRSVELRFKRARVFLQLRVPESAASDAYKALLVCKASSAPEHVAIEQRSKAALLLCQSLFFAQDFDECERRIGDFRDASRKGVRQILPHYLTKLRELQKFALGCKSDEQRQYESASHDSRMAESRQNQDQTYGQIKAPTYQWIKRKFRRSGKIRGTMDKELGKVSMGACSVKKSSVPEALVQDCYGIYTNMEVDEGDLIFKEKPILVATDRVAKECCNFCFTSLNNADNSSVTTALFCSASCRQAYESMYGNAHNLSNHIEGKVRSILTKRISSRDTTDRARPLVSAHLVCQALLHSVYLAKQKSDLHPLDMPPLSQLVGYGSGTRTVAFSFVEDIQMPIEVLGVLGADVFADVQFDMDVIMEVASRLEVNSWEEYQDMDGGPKLLITGVNSCSSLLNLSCRPNAHWERDADTGFMVIKSLRPIQAGEELYISYLSDVPDDASDQARDPSDQDDDQAKKDRMRMLQTWTENGEHHCVLCFPDPVSQSEAANTRTQIPKRKGDETLVDNPPKRLGTSRKLLRSARDEDVTFASLSIGYDSGDEFRS